MNVIIDSKEYYTDGNAFFRIIGRTLYECNPLPGVEEVVIPDRVYEISRNVLGENKKGVKRIIFPRALERIESGAFMMCNSLTEIDIPWRVKYVEEYAFSSCKDLERVTISEGVKTIDNSAFSNCEALSYVSIPKSVTCIEPNAFAYCKRIEHFEIDINPSLKVSDTAFSGTAISSEVRESLMEHFCYMKDNPLFPF